MRMFDSVDSSERNSDEYSANLDEYSANPQSEVDRSESEPAVRNR